MVNRTLLEAEKARRCLYEFVMQAWHVVEPSTPFIDGLPIRAICQHLQAVTQGRIRNLIINVPPGHAKSLLTAVFWPAWIWIDHPHARFLFSSYREPLALRDSLRCRRLIESEFYRARWGRTYQLRGDQNQKSRFENTATGYRIVVPMGTGTGERGDYVVVDDPHSVDQAESEAERRSAVDWWNGSMATRVNDLATGHKVVIQQRLHEADLTGDLLAKGDWELLCLPAEFEPERRCSTCIGWTDQRERPGELLWPEKFSKADLEGLQVSLGSYRYAGQYQQRPAPADGGIFKRSWFGFWRPAHMESPPVPVRTANGELCSIHAIPIPAELDTTVQSWDMSFKDLATSDYVVGQVWGARKGDRFLLDQLRGHMDMPETKEAIKDLSRRWPKAAAKLIEDKANGLAVIQELQHEMPGLIPVNPEGGKVARAHAVSPQLESRNVYLPHPAIAPWVDAFIEEVIAFPNGRNDDQVDAMTQALNRLRGTNSLFSVAESQIKVNPFTIPESWPRGFAMMATPAAVGALWGARDPAGTIFLYAEHLFAHSEPAQNARAILSQGSWIPGMLNTTGSQKDRYRVIRLYRELGLQVQSSAEVEEASAYQVLHLVASNKLKVFASLPGFLGEYRIGDEQSLLLLCCQSLIVCRDRMRTRPVARRVTVPYIPPGDRAWMI